MKAFFLKIRKTTGWALIALSILLMLLGFLVLIPSFGDIFGITRNVAIAGGLYVASMPTWYLGLLLLGPEIIAKTKELYNVTKRKIWRRE
tara:strand:- start:158 stop:427 length:270 start_codon:yes stop_codon:yes gene_type:complete